MQPDELGNLYREHRQGLFALALSVTRCRSLAEDSLHTAMERLVRTERSAGDLTAYVFAAVRNAAIDQLRRRPKADAISESLFESTAVCPTENLIQQERRELLQSSIDSLSDAEREVVVLKSQSELTFEAIGQVLSESPKTVATRYRRALLKLKQKLEGTT